MKRNRPYVAEAQRIEGIERGHRLDELLVEISIGNPEQSPPPPVDPVQHLL
jgi:hypothetical protein